MVQCYMQTKKQNVRTVHQVLFTISAHRFLSVANLARSSRERSCGQSAVKDPAGTALHTRKVLCGADVLVVVEGCDPNSGDVADG